MIVIENSCKRHYFPSPDHISVTADNDKVGIEITCGDQTERIGHEYKDTKTAEIAKVIICRQLEQYWGNNIIINLNAVQSDG